MNVQTLSLIRSALKRLPDNLYVYQQVGSILVENVATSEVFIISWENGIELLPHKDSEIYDRISEAIRKAISESKTREFSQTKKNKQWK